MLNLYRMFDLDGSGSISANELQFVFQFMGLPCDKDTCNSIVKAVDADGSGEIEWDEFLQVLALISTLSQPDDENALSGEDQAIQETILPTCQVQTPPMKC